MSQQLRARTALALQAPGGAGSTPSSAQLHGLVVVLSLLSMTAVLQVNLVMPLLPRIGETFGVSASALGWLLGAGAATMAIAAPWTSAWSDRRGKRQALMVGVGIQAAGLIIQTVSWSFTVLLLARIFTAIGSAFLVGVCLSYVTHFFPVHRRGRIFGLVGGAQGLGLILGPPAATFFAGIHGFRMPLGLFALSVVGLWLLAAVVLPVLPVSSTREDLPSAALLKHPGLRALLFATFVDGLVLEGALTMFPFWMESVQDWHSSDVSIIFLIIGCAFVVSQPLAGVLTDDVDQPVLQLVGAAGGAVILAVLPQLGAHFAYVCMASALWVACLSMSLTARICLVSRLIPQDNQGRYMGLSCCAWAAGAGLGAAGAGMLFEAAGFQLIAIVAAAAMAASGAIVAAAVSRCAGALLH